MSRAVVTGIAFHVPERVVTNDELTRYMETSDAWIRQRTGIEQRRWAADGEGASDLALKAAQQALEKAGKTASDIEAIVYATLSPDHNFPGDGCFLGAKLGIPGVPALDVRNQCSGFLYGLSVAESWIRSGTYKTILLVGAEVHSTGIDVSTRGRDVAVIFGDGAGAAIIEGTDDPVRGVYAVELHADGRHARDLWVEAPASRYHPRLTQEMLDEGKHYPRMDGAHVFKHAVVRIPEVVRSVLAKAGIGPEDVKLFIPHQANLRIAEAAQKSLGLKDEQVYNDIQKYGNTTAASIPIALCEGIEARGVKPGDWVVLGAFGAGFTWAAAAMRW